MKLLLDTCTFLWMIWDEPPLNTNVRSLLADPANELFVSVVSIWEATSKHRIGKLSLNTNEPAWLHFTRQRQAHGIHGLSLAEADIRHIDALPDIHRDPFDRLLICQSIEQGLIVVTPDAHISRYPIQTFW